MSEEMQGVFTALVTPFRGEDVDQDALAHLVEVQIEQGVHGLVPCGTTGESPTLSTEEHNQVVRFVVERTAGRVPVIAGTGSNSTREAVSHTRRARESGADAALVVLPYYNKPTPAGIVAHFRAVAAEGLPVVLYNIPGRCVIGLDLDTYKELAVIPGIVATKEASGSLDLIESVLRETSLKVLSGDDSLTFPLLCLGGHGIISVTSNIAPRAMVDLYDYAIEGNLAAARMLHRRLRPLMDALFIESNPAPVKAALASLGYMEDIVRRPLVPVSDGTRAALETALAETAGLHLRPR